MIKSLHLYYNIYLMRNQVHLHNFVSFPAQNVYIRINMEYIAAVNEREIDYHAENYNIFALQQNVCAEKTANPAINRIRGFVQ